ncbi:MAG: hypothetical protein HKP09_08720, partial [Enterobacterales bacterium]|nr:hypothetical protein [Enterobacterales bacterium]
MARKYLSKMTRNVIDLTLFAVLSAVMVFIACYLYVSPQLPAVETLKEYKLQTPMSVFSADGQLIANYGEKRRIPISFEDIPNQLNEALIATEDKRFYSHGGVDPIGIARAVFELVSTGRIGGGGSTITMQLARNFFLTFDQTFTRKTKEIFLSWKIERSLSKQEILTLYWNKIDFSNRANGIGAAAQVYYGTTVDKLTLPQLAILAGIPKGPTTHNPLSNPEKAFNRRNHVLNRMFVENYITEDVFQEAIATPLSATYHGSRVTVSAPYVAEMVRSEMISRFGREQAYTAGYRVFTTIDSGLQEVSRKSLRKALTAYDRRHGYRGAEQSYSEIADWILASLVTDSIMVEEITDDVTAINNNVTDGDSEQVRAAQAPDTLPPIMMQLADLDLAPVDQILNDFRILGELQP